MLPKCDRCGQFCVPAEWKIIYSGVIPEPDHERYRCARCVETIGSFQPQHGIRPEYSCGKFATNGGGNG